MQEVESCAELQVLQMKLHLFTETFQSKYLTAKLWLEYMEIGYIMARIHESVIRRYDRS